MVPVPAYLRNHAQLIKANKKWTTFSFSCTCGCDTFVLYRNVYTADEEQAMKPYYDALIHSCTGGLASTCTIDEDGTVHHWRLLTPAGLDGTKEEGFIPERPFFAGISVMKIQCTHCGAEHVIFDSRCHGYDAMTSVQTEEERNYTPQFRKKCKSPSAIEIKVENDPSREVFNGNTGLSFDEAQYSNAFSWIKIYAVNVDGKRRMIFEHETA